MAFAAFRPQQSRCLQRAILRVLPCLVVSLSICAARSDALTTISVEGCGEHPAVVELNETLNDVALELSHGVQLNDAIDRIGSPVARSVSVQVIGPTDDAAIREIIEDRYCMSLNDAPYTDIGTYRSDKETWIVLAARAVQPAAEDAAAIAARVLELVNAAREESRRCGRRRFEAAPPLSLSRVLTETASRQARDMASHHSLDHRGSDGSDPGERISRAGYRWRAIGENIAAGQPNADAVVADWLESSEHCKNIMEPQFTEMGVAFELAPSEQPAIYWALVFATPE